MPKHIAVYVRVSTVKQRHKSQMPELKQWVEANAGDEPVKLYKDKASGKNMDRSEWKKLETAINRNRVSKVVVWKLDRLGRKVTKLSELFDFLNERNVPLISLKDGLDLSTPAGKLVAHVLASVAEYERETIGERIVAGQAIAKKEGKRWGGGKKGRRVKVTEERERTILRLKSEGVPVTRIAETVKVSRPTVYKVLQDAELPQS